MHTVHAGHETDPPAGGFPTALRTLVKRYHGSERQETGECLADKTLDRYEDPDARVLLCVGLAIAQALDVGTYFPQLFGRDSRNFLPGGYGMTKARSDRLSAVR